MMFVFSTRMRFSKPVECSIPFLSATLVFLAYSAAIDAQNMEPSGFLESAGKLTKAQLAEVASGQTLALTLTTKNKIEIDGIGAVKLHVPPDLFVSQFQNIQEFKKTSEVLQIGRFSEPATDSDLAPLTVDTGDLRALQSCKPGSCPVKVSAALLDAYRKRAGDSSSYPQKAAAFRHVLVEYVNDYRRRGDAALMLYNDESPAVNLAHEFHDLLDGFQTLHVYAPEFVEYLHGRSGNHLEHADDFIYWAKEDAGFKAVTSLTHVLIYRKMIQGRIWYFIASKNIYSNHYLESSLGISVISEDPGNGCWLVYVNRSRTDILRGWLASIRRSIIESRVRSVMKKQLAAIKKKLETSVPKPKA
jgi:hypothetical protein